MTKPAAVIGWDTPIDATAVAPSFHMFPNGTVVDYEITDFKRSTSKAGELMADLKLACVDDEGNTGTIFESVLLRIQWKVLALFKSVGQRVSGQTIRPDWDKLVGSTGRAKLEQRSYTDKNGEKKTVNSVKEFLEPAS